MNDSICYLNTDLDLTSIDDLTGLADALETRGVFPLHVTHAENGIWHATFETDIQFAEPERNIAAMLAAIESLPDKLRSVWSGCTHREFNIGYDCGNKQRARFPSDDALSTGTVQKALKNGLTGTLALPVLRGPLRALR